MPDVLRGLISMSQTDINVSGQQETPVVMATEASAIRRCSILPEGNARSASEGGKCLADRPKTLSLSRVPKKEKRQPRWFDQHMGELPTKQN